MKPRTSIIRATWSKDLRADFAMPTKSFFAEYEILEELGRGGVGETYSARARTPDQGSGAPESPLVCLKVLGRQYQSPNADMRQAAIDSLRHEAEVVGTLDHPNIARLLDAGEHRGAFYLVFELVQGANLLEVMAMHRPALPPSYVAHIGLEVAKALSCAHDRDVVHRDVKPTNILISEAGEVKLVDFGLAKMGATDASQFTQHIGTPRYWAPEQIRGESLTAATDIYALGVVLYEAVVGAHPYHDDNPATFRDHVLAGAVQFDLAGRGIPERLARTIQRCIDPDPRARFPTAALLCEALGEAEILAVERAAFGELASSARSDAPDLFDEEDDDFDYDDSQTEGGMNCRAATRVAADAGGRADTLLATVADRVADIRDEPTGGTTRPGNATGPDTVTAAPAALAAGAKKRLPDGLSSGDSIMGDLSKLARGAVKRRSEPDGLGPSPLPGAGGAPLQAAHELTSDGPSRGRPLWLVALVAVGAAAVWVASSGPQGATETESGASLHGEPSPDENASRAKAPAAAKAPRTQAAGAPAAAAGQSDPSARTGPVALEGPSVDAVGDGDRGGAASQVDGAEDSAQTNAPVGTPDAVPLTIGVIPWGNVKVDGRAVGRSPVTVHVEPGLHVITATRGQEKRSRRVTVADKPHRVLIEIR